MDMFTDGIDVRYFVRHGLPADARFVIALCGEYGCIDIWFDSELLDPSYEMKRAPKPQLTELEVTYRPQGEFAL